MRASSNWLRIAAIAMFVVVVAGSGAALALMLLKSRGASPEDVRAAIAKANLYIELVKGTERAVDSWDRYASWVNMKAGPTGMERYISYGMYELHDVAGLLKEVRGAARMKPSTAKLDAIAKRYIEVYERLAPVMNGASRYYDRKGYQADGAAEGRVLHGQLVPLVTRFLAERETLTSELRIFVREVEQQEVAAIDKREGKSRAWHAAQVMHALNRVFDLFPRNRPTPIDAGALEEMIRSLGPSTPGEKFDEIIAGVARPTGVVIDIKRLDAAIQNYALAVETFDRFAADKPDGFNNFKEMPRQMLAVLRALLEPLVRSQGRDFEGSGPLIGRVVEGYFAMLSASSPIANSQLRYLQ